jgi:outer membrane protein TolC
MVQMKMSELLLRKFCVFFAGAAIFLGANFAAGQQPEASSSPESLNPEKTAPSEEAVSSENSFDLRELLTLARANTSFRSQIESTHRLAKAKRRQVELEIWFNQFDLRVLSGVVPNATVDRSSADAFLFGFESGDFRNDFSFSELGPFVSVDVKAVQPIFTFGKISGYRGMADANIELSRVEEQKEVLELHYLLKKAYYTLLFSQDARVLLEEVRDRLNKAEEQVEDLLIEGADNVEENDRLKISVFRADVESRALDALRGERVARAGIEELTGVNGSWRLEAGQLEAERISSLSWEDVLEQSIRRRPEIQQIDSYLAVKEAEKRTIRADLLPDIFVAGEFQYGVAPGRDQVSHPYLNDSFNRFQAGVALGLQQDLGFHRTRNRIQQIEAEISKIRAQRERLVSLSRVQAEDAFERAYSAQKGIEINEKGFRAARSWLTSTGLAFSLGTAPTKDVLESYAAYFKARFDLLRSTYDLNLHLAELSKISGAEVVDRLQD